MRVVLSGWTNVVFKMVHCVFRLVSCVFKLVEWWRIGEGVGIAHGILWCGNLRTFIVQQL